LYENKQHSKKIAESMTGKSCVITTFAPTKSSCAKASEDEKK